MGSGELTHGADDLTQGAAHPTREVFVHRQSGGLSRTGVLLLIVL